MFQKLLNRHGNAMFKYNREMSKYVCNVIEWELNP